MPILSSLEWDKFIAEIPGSHLLQTSMWGELKSRFGWEVTRVVHPLNDGHIGAQLLFRRIATGWSMAYLPKGPVYNPCQIPYPLSQQGFWNEVDQICRKKRAIFLKVEPDYWIGAKPSKETPDDSSAQGKWVEEATTPPPGFIMSPHAIQPMRTLIVNLRGDDNQILARMKQKTRYNIKLAYKRGVVVHPSTDMEAFYQLMEITGERDHFGVHSLDYYQQVHELFSARGACELLIAKYKDVVLGALMVFLHGKRAWYLYGASSNEQRDLMPTYILQWEAMRWARSRGCEEYDLWGVPDVDEETLEANFTQRSDQLWGVYRFKRGFGGELRRSAGPWDRIYQKTLYWLYRWRTSRLTSYQAA